ncbi:MAG: hypothetical protein MJ151_01840 [Lachnospiraceae bacterium]|nr:hypothetical protein [Lachnospiraceae bacterium]
MKKKIFIITIICSLLLLVGCTHRKEWITNATWDINVRKALNTLIDNHGGKEKKNYVIFDFDNTSSIFDVEEQLKVYQLETMAFAIRPDDIYKILAKDLTSLDKDLSYLGYGKGSYDDWLSDISEAYKKLYDIYGPFDGEEVSESEMLVMMEDDYWKEFATKMLILYSIVYDNQSADVAYPWGAYWFSGMTSEQVYSLAYHSHKKYKSIDTCKVKWKSPESIKSKVGIVDTEFICGISVTTNIIELWKAFKEAGIDVWVCSASFIDVIRAAVDVWGIHDYIKGITAMTSKTKDGRYINEYDYESGYAYLAKNNSIWEKGKLATKAQTQSKGKVIAIQNAIMPYYGKGPIAGFMDSSGDFNFCTEFKDLKLVVCFNRASRKVTDGGGLISVIATYQKNVIKKDLLDTNASSDTLYVLQGRDENGSRKLRSSDKTIRYSETEKKLFANEDNEKMLRYIINNDMTISDALDKFSIKTKADDSVLGFEYGFLDTYDGYHSR